MNITAKIEADKRSMSDQIPFALAVTLTKVAKRGQAAVLDSIQDNFTLRSNWANPSNRFGVKISSATKRNLEATVGTDASWLEPFETTGVKKPKGRAIALPVIGSGARKTFPAKIPRSLLPKSLAGRAFVLQTKAGRILYLRAGRGKKKKLTALYFLDPFVRVKTKPVLFEPVRKEVEKHFQTDFDQALAKAIQTAR